MLHTGASCKGNYRLTTVISYRKLRIETDEVLDHLYESHELLLRLLENLDCILHKYYKMCSECDSKTCISDKNYEDGRVKLTFECGSCHKLYSFTVSNNSTANKQIKELVKFLDKEYPGG